MVVSAVVQLAAADESFADNLIMVAALAYKQMRDAIAPKPRGFTAIGVKVGGQSRGLDSELAIIRLNAARCDIRLS